jgi:hypothetical protein
MPSAPLSPLVCASTLPLLLPLSIWFVHYDVLFDLFQMPKNYPLDLLLDNPTGLTMVPERGHLPSM